LVLGVGELLGGDALFDGRDHGADGGVVPLFECAVDTHQDGLTIRAVLAAVPVAVVAEDDRRPNRGLGAVFVQRNALLIEGREQLVPMAPQAL